MRTPAGETDPSTVFGTPRVLVPGRLQRYAALAASAFSHGVVAWLIVIRGGDLSAPARWVNQFLVLLGLSFCSALYAYLRPLGTKAIVAKLVQLIAHIVMTVPSGTAMIIDGVLLWTFICDVAFVVPRRRVLILMGVHWVAMMLAQIPVMMWDGPAPAAPLSQLVVFALFGLVSIGANVVLSGRDQARRRLETEVRRLDQTVSLLSQANLDFQNYAERAAVRSMEAERRRIAREVHDTVGYTLVNMMMMLEAAKDISVSSRSKLIELLERARDQAQLGLGEVRRALRSLRELRLPLVFGRKRYLSLAQVFQNATGVSVQLHFGNTSDTFGELVDDTIYRLIQEGLTNSFRHGRASNVSIYFWVHDHDLLEVRVLDNGEGSAKIVPGIGIEGMQERLAFIGGELEAFSNDAGFNLVARIPLDVRESADATTRPEGDGLEGLRTS